MMEEKEKTSEIPLPPDDKKNNMAALDRKRLESEADSAPLPDDYMDDDIIEDLFEGLSPSLNEGSEENIEDSEERTTAPPRDRPPSPDYLADIPREEKGEIPDEEEESMEDTDGIVFQTAQPIDASSDLQESKDTGPPELALHRAIKKLDESFKDEGIFFVSEKNFCYLYNLLQKLDIRKKNDDGNTAFLLLTKALVERTATYSVNGNMNYAVILFKSFLLQDFEITSKEFLQMLEQIKNSPRGSKFKNQNLDQINFSLDGSFSPRITPSKTWDLCTAKKNILTNLVNQKPIDPSEWKNIGVEPRPECGFFGAVYCLIDATLREFKDFRSVERRVKRNLAIQNLFRREFDEKINYPLISSILILANKEDETPLSLLIFRANIIKADERLYEWLVEADDLICNYTENFASHWAAFYLQHNNPKRASEILTNISAEVGVLKKLLVTPYVNAPNHLSRADCCIVDILTTASRKNDVENIHFAFNEWEARSPNLQDGNTSNFMFPLGGKSLFFNDMLENRCFDALSAMLHRLPRYKIKMDDDINFYANCFSHAIRNNNDEVITSLLLLIKKDNQLFKKIQELQSEKGGYTILDLALIFKKDDITRKLTSEGFRKTRGMEWKLPQPTPKQTAESIMTDFFKASPQKGNQEETPEGKQVREKRKDQPPDTDTPNEDSTKKSRIGK